ncbi:MAG: glycosyltransferase family 4 protein, partial [Armatimonadetes bacterium]|nr:glycosyltransferase family 4 protein [Armatimonadota bacterium]
MNVRLLVSIVPGSSVTGGEIYIQKVLAFLKQAGDSVATVSWGHLPSWLRRYPLFCNLWAFFKLVFRESSLIIEPESHRNHLFLCNWLLQFTRHRVVVFIQLVRSARSAPWPVSRWQKWVYHIFLGTADLVIVNSNYVGNGAIVLGAREERVKIICPAGQELPGQGELATHGVAESPTILCVSNLEERKGQEYLLRAVALLREQEFSLMLVGSERAREAAYAAKLRDVTKTLDLTDKVRFVGRLEGKDLAAAYRQADVFVFPSLMEGYGLVLLEAMSFGLPVVTTRVGGIPEIVSDGVEGILVPPRDENALADAIAELLACPAKRREMGEKGMARARQQPSWDEVCK